MKNWKRVGKDKIYKLKYRQMINRSFKTPNGEFYDFDLMAGVDVACIFALTQDNKVILARQFRPGPELVLDELPGGKIEKGQTPKEAAEKELLEETGYKGDLKLIRRTYRSAYITTVRYHFVATNCQKIQEPQNEGNEITETVLMTVPEFKKHLKTGNLTDTATAYIGMEYLKL